MGKTKPTKRKLEITELVDRNPKRNEVVKKIITQKEGKELINDRAKQLLRFRKAPNIETAQKIAEREIREIYRF